MSSLIPLVDLSSSLWEKVRKKWFRKSNEQMENSPRETDFLAERPENWYTGPLIFPAFPEEGVKRQPHKTIGQKRLQSGPGTQNTKRNGRTKKCNKDDKKT